MTCARRDGHGSDFGEWSRAHPDIESNRYGLAVTDVDWIFHKYAETADGRIIRNSQRQLWLETKCMGAMPNDFQRQTLFFNHQLLNRHSGNLTCAITGRLITIRHYGVFVLSMSGTSPHNSHRMQWLSFDASGCLVSRPIDESTLLKLLRFEIRPDWILDRAAANDYSADTVGRRI